VLALSLLPVACGGTGGAPTTEAAGAADEHGRVAAAETPVQHTQIDAAPGVAVDLVLPKRTCHDVSVPLEVGDGARVSLDQHGVDLFTTLLDPVGKEVVTFDTPVQDRGLDAGAWIAQRAGTYRLEICAPGKGATGPYRLEVEYPLVPDDRLRARAAGFLDYARGGVLAAQGDRQAARRTFESALAHWQAADDVLAQAWAEYRIGRMHEKLGALAAAGEAFQRSAKLFGTAGDSLSQARSAAWAGNFFLVAERFRGAVVAYQEARAAAARAGDAAVERNAVEGLARSFTQVHEPLQALELFRQLLTEPRFEAGAEPRARALRLEAQLYQDLGEAERAFDLLGRARALAEREGVVSGEKGKVLLGLGGALLDLDRIEAAETMLVEALRVFEEQKMWSWLGWASSRLGRLYVQAGRLSDAEPLFNRALDLGRSRQDEKLVAEVQINRGRLAAAEGRHEQAITVCQEALEGLTAANQTLWSASALNCLADNYAALGRLVQAQDAIEQAIGRVESVRRQPTPDTLRRSLLADKHDYYGRLIEILVRRDALEPGHGFAARAFEVAERSRSRTLLDEIDRARREHRAQADPRLLARSEALADEIEQGEGRLLRDEESSGSDEEVALRRRLEELRAQRDLVEGQIESTRPGGDLADLAAPVTLETVQHELLRSGEVQLVELYLGERASVAWVLGADSVSVERLPPRQEIERLARQASELMAESYDRRKRVRGRLAAEALAQVVVEPVAASLTAPHLVIIADGALTGVSFAALPLAGEDEAPLLGDRFEITRLPSASVGVALERRSPVAAPRGRLAVVADPVFEPDDPRLRGERMASVASTPSAGAATEPVISVTRAAGVGRISRLEGAGEEARAIASFVPPKARRLLLGFDADRRKILDGAVSGYRVVHFATHGLVLGKLSGLVLSQVDRQGQPIDGFLRSWEVYDLGLQADLVVLSACKTGMGHYLAGEGMMGLSRAFLAAGASQVLVSLWDVDDRATAALMERFYRAYLVDGQSPSRALHQAQEWMRAQPQWRSPHDWAGFVLQGIPH